MEEQGGHRGGWAEEKEEQEHWRQGDGVVVVREMGRGEGEEEEGVGVEGGQEKVREELKEKGLGPG